jgi:tRNA A-37 threonylcarbamoyl transferase component Bud32
MSANDDLASWGEPPATTHEQAEADSIERLLEQLERGETLPDAAFQSIDRLRRSSAVFRREAGLLDERGPSAPEPPGEGGPPSLPDPFPGEFRIVRLLGQGAFGEVWLADDLMLGCQRALKTLRLSGNSEELVGKLAAMQNEARILAQFSHPNLVQVHAWRESGGAHYLVLQYVPGGSLEERLKEKGALPWDSAAWYIADVGHGLLEVHRRGIVHRDIKPANILWQPDEDRALLTDFGISARLLDRGPAGGTPRYMAPEAFNGHVSPALDVYSLAVTLFRLLTGEVPYSGRTIPALVEEIVRGLPADDPRCAGIPEPLERIIRSGLAADPQRRPALRQFVAALRAALNQLLADSLSLPVGPKSGAPPVYLRLAVGREITPDRYQPVATTRAAAGGLQRNMKKVPRPPEQVVLRSGDRVRVEVLADQAGYVTVFNVGPGGDLNLLYPDEAPTAATPPTIQGGVPLHVLDVQMEPPAGRERLFAVWTRRPVALQPQHLQGIAERGAMPASGPYQATRNMVRVKQSVQQLPPDEWQAVVLDLDHVA